MPPRYLVHAASRRGRGYAATRPSSRTHDQDIAVTSAPHDESFSLSSVRPNSWRVVFRATSMTLVAALPQADETFFYRVLTTDSFGPDP
ncbi:hypothetical protein ACQP2U_37875 [Nocardia sp. CA-084685]|uniref:hypothetical protein n=1 Tax=Nocardia sp. CA-084685 TaxID=3239970 RepID=UPI003D956770